MTRAYEGSIPLSASVALPARYSCQKLKQPLMTFTSHTAMPSSGSPATKAMMPAAHRRHAMRWVKLERSASAGDFLRSVWMRFLPSRSWRDRASCCVSPAREVPSAERASAAVSRSTAAADCWAAPSIPASLHVSTLRVRQSVGQGRAAVADAPAGGPNITSRA